jgi:hypothetical protein
VQRCVPCAMEEDQGIGVCRWKGIGFWFNGGRGSVFGLMGKGVQFYRKPSGFHFAEFYRSRYFEFFNSVLTKNIAMDSNFFRIFYYKCFQIFENFKFDWPVFGKSD